MPSEKAVHPRPLRPRELTFPPCSGAQPWHSRWWCCAAWCCSAACCARSTATLPPAACTAWPPARAASPSGSCCITLRRCEQPGHPHRTPHQWLPVLAYPTLTLEPARHGRRVKRHMLLCPEAVLATIEGETKNKAACAAWSCSSHGTDAVLTGSGCTVLGNCRPPAIAAAMACYHVAGQQHSAAPRKRQ